MNAGAIVHALEHTKVRKAHQLILVRYAHHANKHGLSWPSHSLLARETGYTRQYVIQVTHDLVAEGVIAEVFDGKGRRRYHLYAYDFHTQRCGCEQSPADEIQGLAGCELSSQAPESACELSSQAPEGNCELSSGGVNSPACKSSWVNENATESIRESIEKTGTRAREIPTTDDSRSQTIDTTSPSETHGWERPERDSPFWCEAHAYCHSERLPDYRPDCARERAYLSPPAPATPLQCVGRPGRREGKRACAYHGLTHFFERE